MNKKALWVAGGLLACLYGQAQLSVKLSDLDIAKTWQEYGNVRVGTSVTGEPATLQGKTYTDVIGTHAKSILKVDLQKDATRFRTQIGVVQSKATASGNELVIIPLVDGTKLHFRKEGERKQFLGVVGTDGKTGKGDGPVYRKS